VIGRPILYRTSKDFLMRFGLGDVDELPSLKEFEALAREALGADDGIAFESETPDGEPPADVAAPEATTGAGAAGVSGEAMGTVLGSAENAPRDFDSRAAEQVGKARPTESRASASEMGANADAEASGENPGESTDRAAKKAAPGSQ
jgi:segregation and condensation protein B